MSRPTLLLVVGVWGIVWVATCRVAAAADADDDGAVWPRRARTKECTGDYLDLLKPDNQLPSIASNLARIRW